MVKKLKKGDMFIFKKGKHKEFLRGEKGIKAKKEMVYKSESDSGKYHGVDFYNHEGELDYLSHKELVLVKKYKGGFENE